VHSLMINILARNFSLLHQNIGDRFGAGLPTSMHYPHVYCFKLLQQLPDGATMHT